MDNMGEQLFQLIAPYLPNSVASPLHQLLTLPSNIMSNPTQLITLGASLLALYAAVMSMWSTIRMSFRAAIFTLKWGAIASAIAVAWSGYNNAGTEEGATKGLRTAGNIGKKAFGLGSQGVNWYLGGKGQNQKRSASGRQRTWAKATDDGGWDDPDEVDLGAGTNDVMKTVQDAVLTFLAGGGDTSSAKKTKTKAKKTAKKTQQQGNDLGSMAQDFLLGKAKQYAGF